MITTKSRYALRAVIDIAQNASSGSVRRTDIAHRQQIPRYYLERILLMLRDRGILRSRKGPGGGFVLGRLPEELTAWDIIDAVGEGHPPLECLLSENPECRRYEHCDARCIWAHLYNVVRAEMRKITLQQILAGTSKLKYGPDIKTLFSDAV